MTTKNRNDDIVAIDRRAFTGMNSKYYAGIIGDKQMATASGVDFTDLGIVSGIKGFSSAANDISNNRVLGLKRFNKEGGADWLVMVDGTNVRHWTGSGNWSSPDDSGFTTNLDMSMIVGAGRMWLSNGTDNVHSWNQTTFTDLGSPATSTNPPAWTDGIFAYNRLFVYKGSFVYYTDIMLTDTAPENFDQSSTGKLLGIETLNGDDITGLVDLGNNEIVVFKENSVHTLDVSNATPANWTKPYSFYDNGCIGKRAFVRVGNDVFYLSREANGITSIGKNAFNVTVGLSVAISDPIYTGYMDRINWNYAHLSTARHYDNKIIFCVPLDNSTTPNTAIIYFLHPDSSINGWAIKEGITANAFEVFKGSLYFGDSDEARIYKLFDTFDNDGSAMQRTIETRIEDFSERGVRYQQKCGKELRLDFLTGDDNGEVEIFFRTDNGAYRSLGKYNTGTSEVSLPATLPMFFEKTGVTTIVITDLDQDNNWTNCQIKIEQNQSGKTFQFLGYLLIASVRTVKYTPTSQE